MSAVHCTALSLMALQAMAPCLVARKVNFSNAEFHKREGFVASDAFCREVIRVPICNRLALRSPDFQFFFKTAFSPQHKIPARYRRRTDRGCHSTGLLMCRALGNITLVTEWRPAVEQLMLITSIALAYIAGIATPGRPALVDGPFGILPVRTNRSSDEDATLPPKPQLLEKQPQSQRCEETYEGDRWSVTQSKIAAALSKLAKDEGDVETYEIHEGAVRNPVLSLQAISAIPRLRLLMRSLEHLRNEVDSISDGSKLLSPIEWSKLSRDLLCQSIEPICRSWLALEPSLANREDVTEASSVMKNEPEDVSQSVKLRRSIRQGRDLALNYLQRSGKAELYMDVIFFLRFKTTRPGSCWGQNLMSKHASNVLEDLVVASADAASAIYLGRSSVMGGREENDWPILVRSSIKSTRALERFRNEVALRSWLQQNFSSVVAMFEDRFELWTIQRLCNGGQVSEEEIKKSTEQGPQARKNEDPAQGIKLAVVQLSARRSKELRALTGWRYFYSLYLEFSDIVGPLLKVLISKFGDAVSFLLVRLIGRALGLIYQGVRQSIRWSPK